MSEKTRDQIQLSYGRLVDWTAVNPILASGEVACVFDNDTLEPIDLRFGNGIVRFNQLPSLVNNDRVYTKEEITELLSVIKASISTLEEKHTATAEEVKGLTTVTIPAIKELIDVTATKANPLTSLSTVENLVKKALNSRIGRPITFTADGQPFDTIVSLTTGPWFLDGVEITHDDLKTNDTAEVENAEYSFKYDGALWQPNTTKLVLTEEQEAALNSGITEEKVTTFENAAVTTSENKNSIKDINSRLTEAENTQKNLVNSVAHKNTSLYEYQVVITSSGTNYLPCTFCTVNGVKGMILTTLTNDLVKGSISSLVLFASDKLIPEDVAYEIVAESGAGGLCTVKSTKVTKDLKDTDDRLVSLLNKYSLAYLTRGAYDGTLRAVKDGELTPLFASATTRYVDNSYTGKGEGIELAPYTTGIEALNSLGTATAGTVVYAAGTYDELSIAGTYNKNVVGYAVGEQTGTTVNGIYISSTAENIGLRDLKISRAFSISQAKKVYGDNLTIDTPASISANDTIAFTHSTFNVTVAITGTVGSVVEFDCCTFSDESILRIESGPTVILRNCTNVTPVVELGGTYIQLSGSISPVSTNPNGPALIANSGAAFVGLFAGTAIKKDNSYAKISIADDTHYALGAFLFDAENSKISETATRLSYDGLSGNQIVVSPRTDANTEGYRTNSTYLSEHLDAISKALRALSSVVTQISIESGEEPGDIILVGISGGGVEVFRSEPFNIREGLGTAAFTNIEIYATAAQGAKADTAYQKPASGIPETDLDTSVQDILNKAESTDNKVAEINANGTTIQYPTAKAVYDQLLAPFTTLSDRVPTATGVAEDDKLVTRAQLADYTQGKNRLLVSTATPAGDSTDAFDSWDTLLKDTTKFYYRGATTTPQEGDRANYFALAADGVTEVACQAYYNGVAWVWFSNMSQEFIAEQLAAINSGITVALTDKLAGTGTQASITKYTGSLADEVDKKQTKLPAGTNGKVVTFSGAEGTFGAGRDVASTITSTVSSDKKTFTPSYSGNVNDLSTAAAVANLTANLSSWIKDRLAEKQNNLTLSTDSTWLQIKNNTINYLNDTQLDASLKTLLGTSNGTETAGFATLSEVTTKVSAHNSSSSSHSDIRTAVSTAQSTANTAKTKAENLETAKQNIIAANSESTETNPKLLASTATAGTLRSIPILTNFSSKTTGVGVAGYSETYDAIQTLKDADATLNNKLFPTVTGDAADYPETLLAVYSGTTGDLKGLEPVTSSQLSDVISKLPNSPFIKTVAYQADEEHSLQSNTVYYPKNDTATSIINITATIDSDKIYSNIQFIPRLTDTGEYKSFILLPDQTTQKTLIFRNSNIVLNLRDVQDKYNLTFIDSTVYLYTGGTSVVSGSNDFKFTFINSSAIFDLAKNDTSSHNIKVLTQNSRLDLRQSTVLVIDSSSYSSNITINDDAQISAADTTVNLYSILVDVKNSTTPTGKFTIVSPPISYIIGNGYADGDAIISLSKWQGGSHTAQSVKIMHATSTYYGTVKLATDTKQSVACQSPSSVAGKTYSIQQNTAGQLVVNIPWRNDLVEIDYCNSIQDDEYYPLLIGEYTLDDFVQGSFDIGCARAYNHIYVQPSTGSLCVTNVHAPKIYADTIHGNTFTGRAYEADEADYASWSSKLGDDGGDMYSTSSDYTCYFKAGLPLENQGILKNTVAKALEIDDGDID